MIFTVKQLAEICGGEIRGDESITISAIADLSTAQTGEIAFLDDAKFIETAQRSGASCLIVSNKIEFDSDKTIILTSNAKLAFAKIAAIIHPPNRREAKIHSSAIVSKSAIIGENVYIGAFCRVGENSQVGANTQLRAGAKIGDNVKIGVNCLFHPNVVVEDNCEIGANVIIHAGTIIGADGFGYVRDGANGYVKFPQIGKVVIENDVEIGANCCVDRAALGETRIGAGSKIDNLVQIAHNVTIGERVIIASQTGISGSTIIENDVVIGGQVGIGDHARILSGAIIGSKAGILPNKIVRAGVWWGVPVQPLDDYKRQNALVKSLPRLREEIRQMQSKLKENF
ncbi:MAG: UDP-3-O-(3-hydroxymyristoyl)glucosamine N-acyltransferase [Pyrinomonadaceae bacterium]|nr:UDP-3-O-(3-hydroxymyristoyl)glucosamine N-acyltransferase [Pyrinomonadaceae bacterium]